MYIVQLSVHVISFIHVWGIRLRPTVLMIPEVSSSSHNTLSFKGVANFGTYGTNLFRLPSNLRKEMREGR